MLISETKVGAPPPIEGLSSWKLDPTMVKAFEFAQQEALKANRERITTGDALIGLILATHQEDNPVYRILINQGVKLSSLCRRIRGSVVTEDKVIPNRTSLSDKVIASFMHADALRQQDEEQFISPLHFLAGFDPNRQGVHTVAFQELEISQERVYGEARQQLAIVRNRRMKR